MSDLHWFCLWLGEPKKEFDACEAVKRLGFESFLPCEYKWALRNPRNPRSKLKVRKAYPLLMRYGMVGFPNRQRWSDLLIDDPERPTKVIRGTRIAARPVGMSPARPTQLSQSQVADLAALSHLTVPYAASQNPHKAVLSVQVGDTAKILNPALYGHFGRVDTIMVDRAKVVIEFLGSLRPVEVALDELEAA